MKTINDAFFGRPLPLFDRPRGNAPAPDSAAPVDGPTAGTRATTPVGRSTSSTRETAGAAKRAIEPVAGTLRSRVFEFIRAKGPYGATDAEIELALRMRSQSVTPRRGELVAAGLVHDCGRRRPTESGRLAVVWTATGLVR